MPLFEEITVFPFTYSLLFIPIIDVSDAMKGEKLNQVKKALSAESEAFLPDADEFYDCAVLFAPLEFSDTARVGLQDDHPAWFFGWESGVEGGVADFGEAFRLLGEKMKPKAEGGWMSCHRGDDPIPILLLISDSKGRGDYKGQLNALQENPWFRSVPKFALCFGSNADKGLLAEFTGDRETVFDVGSIKLDLSTVIKRILLSVYDAASEWDRKQRQVCEEESDPDQPHIDARLVSKAIENLRRSLKE